MFRPFTTLSTSKAARAGYLSVLGAAHLMLPSREAGHSKWANIRHKKGKNDKQRAVLFAKISLEIIAASRACEGDLSNIRLSAAITKAKANNVPKENIENSVKRGMDTKTSVNMENVQYEGIGPGSVSVIVEALTDNRKRTAPNVRHIFSKFGGQLGTSGQVSWMFERKGYIELQNPATEAVLEAVIDAGAEDVEELDSGVKIFSKPSDLHIIRKALDEKGVSPSLMEFVYIPNSYTQLNEEDTEKLLQMLEAFDEDCDVQNVFHSAEWRDSMVDNEGNG